MIRISRLIPLLLLFVGNWIMAGPALAELDFRSIGSEVAVMYDGPSLRASPIYVIAPGTPIEVIVTIGLWSKVRDSKGDLAWMKHSELDNRRMVQIRVATAQIRASAGENAAIVFEAANDVLLQLQDIGPPGWLRVKHADGRQGYVKAEQVWGI